MASLCEPEIIMKSMDHPNIIKLYETFASWQKHLWKGSGRLQPLWHFVRISRKNTKEWIVEYLVDFLLAQCACVFFFRFLIFWSSWWHLLHVSSWACKTWIDFQFVWLILRWTTCVFFGLFPWQILESKLGCVTFPAIFISLGVARKIESTSTWPWSFVQEVSCSIELSKLVSSLKKMRRLWCSRCFQRFSTCTSGKSVTEISNRRTSYFWPLPM